MEGEEHGNIIAGPRDLTKPEQVTGPIIRTKLAISELKDDLERNRYAAKQRSSQTFKIICDPAKLGRTQQEMANEHTQSTLGDLELPKATYYAAVIQYLGNYLWQIEDPPIDAKLWRMMGHHTMEYYQAVKIRDNAVSTGKELGSKFITENEKAQDTPF